MHSLLYVVAFLPLMLLRPNCRYRRYQHQRWQPSNFVTSYPDLERKYTMDPLWPLWTYLFGPCTNPTMGHNLFVRLLLSILPATKHTRTWNGKVHGHEGGVIPVVALT